VKLPSTPITYIKSSSYPSPNYMIPIAQTASTEFDSTYVASRGFDGDPNTEWISGISDPNNLQQWLIYSYSEKRILTHYSLTARNKNTNYFPSSFRVQGSNDGVSWLSLDADNNGIPFL
jgi:hypothetical protein